MNSNTFESVNSWPRTIAEMATLLEIRRERGVKCLGRKQDMSACRNDISRASVKMINNILAEIVQIGELTELALSALSQLSGLVLCRRWHQHQADSKKTAWQSILRLPPGTETEEESPTDSSSTRNRRFQDSKSPSSNSKAPKTASQKKPSSAKKATGRATTPPPRQPSNYPQTPPRESSYSRSSTPPGCETRRTPRASPRPSATHTFDSYGPHLTPRSINAKIKAKLLADLKPHDLNTSGYIYGFTFPENHTVLPSDRPLTPPLTPPPTPPDSRASTPAPTHHPTHIKIGHSVAPDRRLAAIESHCRYTPRQLFALPTPHHAHIERLVHLQLHNVRRKEAPRGCPGCGTRHIEWFEVDGGAAEAEAAVKMWTRWAARRPWDGTGRLRREWVERLNEVDLGDVKCWERFLTMT